ncbi:uncharacterized protein C8Q71DRAFT_180763 [Rhodofomes roseus]|uniref:F-box domain-containing protein n=1 Tax=Rhodofomes roseus TaxID=34475 RepID=A0ABQ8K8H2_9APHY|nr:uncharacterized protein C8Q71DRAFT_180763 [Rhodofomes roseus]KAH9833388.1 hypothetical protein C8Q71DRAFT_180763 [Rhodofomes roseus]
MTAMSVECKYNTTARRPRTTINDLPHDVLILIFRDVRQAASLPYAFRGGDRLYLDPWAPYYESVSEHPFPECLASVCSVWRAAMSNVSIFWTRLVIWTGRDPTPLSRIREYLSWSRESLLDIYILRRFSPAIEDTAEKAQMNMILNLLSPSMNRWQLLYMRPLYSSSLPCPGLDLVGRADNLIELILHFVNDDLVTSSNVSSPPANLFDAPKLEQLSMGGVHFREAYVKRATHMPLPPKLTWLGVTGYNSCNAPFPVHELLACITTRMDRLWRVHLDGLQLDCSTHPPAPFDSRRWEANTRFIDIPGDVIAEYHRLLQYTLTDVAHYTRCSLPDSPFVVSTPLADACQTYVYGIADPDALMYYLSAGMKLDNACYSLAIVNCDGLCADVLHKLAKPVSEDAWLCRDVQQLKIAGCTEFSSTDLRAILEARQKANAAYAAAVMTITEIYVLNCGELVPEDREWFNENVSIVHWDDWEGGFDYTPDLDGQYDDPWDNIDY